MDQNVEAGRSTPPFYIDSVVMVVMCLSLRLRPSCLSRWRLLEPDDDVDDERPRVQWRWTTAAARVGRGWEAGPQNYDGPSSCPVALESGDAAAALLFFFIVECHPILAAAYLPVLWGRRWWLLLHLGEDHGIDGFEIIHT